LENRGATLKATAGADKAREGGGRSAGLVKPPPEADVFSGFSTPMRRAGPLALLLLIAAIGVALAGDAPAAGRFTLAPSPEGFTRLDTRTGATAHCAWRDKQWVCERFSEDDDAIRARVGKLERDVGRLHAAVERLSEAVGRIAGKPASSPMADTSESTPVPRLTERAVTRLIEMVRRLKQGLGATPVGA
jgi:hypothetical protein